MRPIKSLCGGEFVLIQAFEPFELFCGLKCIKMKCLLSTQTLPLWVCESWGRLLVALWQECYCALNRVLKSKISPISQQKRKWKKKGKRKNLSCCCKRIWWESSCLYLPLKAKGFLINSSTTVQSINQQKPESACVSGSSICCHVFSMKCDLKKTFILLLFLVYLILKGKRLSQLYLGFAFCSSYFH